jgi:hypothetical protein
MRNGALFAVPMDAERVSIRGGAAGVIDGVRQAVNVGNSSDETGSGQWSVSENGWLAYVPGGTFSQHAYVRARQRYHRSF